MDREIVDSLLTGMLQSAEGSSSPQTEHSG